MDDTWTFDRIKNHELNTLAKQLTELLKGKKLNVSMHEVSPLRSRSAPKAGWGRLQRDVKLRRGFHGDLYIPIDAGISVLVEPVRYGGKKYASTITIAGDHVTIYAPHLEGDPGVLVEEYHTITVVGAHR